MCKIRLDFLIWRRRYDLQILRLLIWIVVELSLFRIRRSVKSFIFFSRNFKF